MAIVRSTVAQISRLSANERYLRVFTLGIGDAASTALCQDLARAGNGLCYMATVNEDVHGKCANLLSAARAAPIASLYGLTIDWGYRANPPVSRGTNGRVIRPTFTFFDESLPSDPRLLLDNNSMQLNLPSPSQVRQAPSTVPDIYPYNRYTVFAILSETTVVPEVVTINGNLPDGSTMALEIPVKRVDTVPLLHTLAARRLILELEGGDVSSVGGRISGWASAQVKSDIAKAAVIELGQDYHLASEFTAFIAIDESDHSDQRNATDDSSDSEEDDFTVRPDGADGAHGNNSSLSTGPPNRRSYDNSPSHSACQRGGDDDVPTAQTPQRTHLQHPSPPDSLFLSNGGDLNNVNSPNSSFSSAMSMPCRKSLGKTRQKESESSSNEPLATSPSADGKRHTQPSMNSSPTGSFARNYDSRAASGSAGQQDDASTIYTNVSSKVCAHFS